MAKRRNLELTLSASKGVPRSLSLYEQDERAAGFLLEVDASDGEYGARLTRDDARALRDFLTTLLGDVGDVGRR